MDATIRNLDEEAYRQLKARAAVEGRTVGEVLNDAIRAYVDQGAAPKKRSILEAKIRDYGPGTERLSEEIDEVVYGK